MIIIFSGYNQRAVIAFLRTLKKNHINDYGIIACGECDTILHTCYREHVLYIRKNKELILEELLYAVDLVGSRSKEEQLFVTPSTEFLNRFLLKHRQVFEEHRCVIPLVDSVLYEQISDKEKFSNICKSYGIEVPSELENINAEVTPFIAKPKKYFSGDLKVYAPQFIMNSQEYHTFIEQHDIGDFYYQEYLDGGISFYLLFYVTKDGEFYCYSQQNLAQQSNGKSILIACASDYHKEDKIIQPYIKLLRNMNFRGLIMIEVRYIHGTYYMIEANPRFWGPSQLFCDLGYNFFEFMLADYGYIESVDTKKIRNEHAFYYWSGGVKGNIFEKESCYWHQQGREIVKSKAEELKMADIYQREDTMEIYDIEKLQELYRRNSKHSGYQMLSSELEKLLHSDELNIVSRYERQRLEYIQQYMDLKNKNILDIGGNTGYFSFEVLKDGAKHVDYYEGNPQHAEFVKIAAKLLHYDKKMNIFPEYFQFDKNEDKYDVILNLNVIHHLGDDFKKGLKKDAAKKKMLEYMNGLSYDSPVMVFQMGFNWKGNCSEGLFPDGTKKEMEQFIVEGTKEYWKVMAIGIAEKKGKEITYQDLNEKNNTRQDDLGEFLNRPLFIMKSLKFV